MIAAPMDASVSNSFDASLTFQIEGVSVRGRLVRLGRELEHILKPHAYPQPVAEILAETLCLSATLASALKYDGLFSLQTQSDGPVSLMVADVTSQGAMRGYARFDGPRVEALSDIASAPVVRLLGAGHMAFTVDQGSHTERYQGITDLDGANISDCAHHYLRNSEQLESAIWLAADVGTEPDFAHARAGALMVQRMPPAPGADPADEDDDWRRAVALLSSLTRAELLDPALSSEDLLFRLYHEDGVRVFESRPLFHCCRCSREKVASTIKSFPAEEILDAQGRAEVVCEFCKKTYHFEEAELEQIKGADNCANSA